MATEEISPGDSVSQVGARSSPGTDAGASRAHAFGQGCGSVLAPTSTMSMKHMTGASHFSCNRCKLVLPVSNMSGSIKNVCSKDVASYKALTDRWSKNRALSGWWKSLSPEGQQQLDIRQHTLPAGSKRNFDEVMYSEIARESAGNEQRERDHFKPWWLFKNDGIAAGLSIQSLENMWQDAVDNRTADAVFVRGQWCVAQFIGVLKDRTTSQTQDMVTKRTKAVESVDSLRELVAGGKKAIDSYGQAHEGARTMAQDTLGIPQTTATPQDHILKPPPAMQFSTAIEKEVATMITDIIMLM